MKEILAKSHNEGVPTYTKPTHCSHCLTVLHVDAGTWLGDWEPESEDPGNDLESRGQLRECESLRPPALE